ncbi:MAG: hypothetical protein RLY31_1134 [Bacteroidota bacterium]
MRKMKLPYLLFAGLLATTALTMTACGDDEEVFPVPVVTLSASEFSGKTGEIATVTAMVNAPGGLKSLTITKFLGTTPDPNYGTNGVKTFTHMEHTETYELNAEGLTTPVRFNFTAEDETGQVGSADFLVTTEASVDFLLTTYNWQWKSKLGKCLASEDETEQILDCEKDNFFSFNADGSYALDFGAITGTGGGTCDFDGFRAPAGWSLNDDQTELTINAVNVFDPNDVQVQLYKITEATTTSLKATQTIDLSVFGCIVYDWTFEFTAIPK